MLQGVDRCRCYPHRLVEEVVEGAASDQGDLRDSGQVPGAKASVVTRSVTVGMRHGPLIPQPSQHGPLFRWANLENQVPRAAQARITLADI